MCDDSDDYGTPNAWRKGIRVCPGTPADWLMSHEHEACRKGHTSTSSWYTKLIPAIAGVFEGDSSRRSTGVRIPYLGAVPRRHCVPQSAHAPPGRRKHPLDRGKDAGRVRLVLSRVERRPVIGNASNTCTAPRSKEANVYIFSALMSSRMYVYTVGFGRIIRIAQ